MNGKRYWGLAAVAALGIAAWLGVKNSDAPTLPKVEPKASELVAARPMTNESSFATEKAQNPVPAQLSPAREVSVRQGSEPLPIDVSPGFEEFLTPANEPADTNLRMMSVRQHRQLQTQLRDSAWSARMESDIRTFVHNELMAQGLDIHRIEMPVIECRMKGCEIQAIGWPEDNNKPGRDLQIILPKMVLGPMAADFDSENTSVMLSSLADGRVGFIAFLPRQTKSGP